MQSASFTIISAPAVNTPLTFSVCRFRAYQADLPLLRRWAIVRMGLISATLDTADIGCPVMLHALRAAIGMNRNLAISCPY